MKLFTVFTWPYDILPSLRLLLKFGRNCYLERGVRNARRLVFARRNNAKMCAVSPIEISLLYALLPIRWSGFKCCKELNNLLPPVLMYLSHHTIAEASLPDVVWKIAASAFCVLFLTSFLAYGSDRLPAVGVGTHWFAVMEPLGSLYFTSLPTSDCFLKHSSLFLTILPS